MGFATAALVGLGAVQVGSSIASGYQQKKEAEYNASLIEQTGPVYDTQIALVEKEKELMTYQANRRIGQVMGATTAMTAGKGLEMSGSPIAIMHDTYTQMEMDKRINQQNLDMQKYNIGLEKSRAMSQAQAYKRAGKTALFQGYTNAFTSALQTGVNYGIMTGLGGAKTAGKL
jgi:hypothetical protein